MSPLDWLSAPHSLRERQREGDSHEVITSTYWGENSYVIAHPVTSTDNPWW